MAGARCPPPRQSISEHYAAGTSPMAALAKIRRVLSQMLPHMPRCVRDKVLDKRVHSLEMGQMSSPVPEVTLLNNSQIYRGGAWSQRQDSLAALAFLVRGLYETELCCIKIQTQIVSCDVPFLGCCAD